MRRFQPVSAVVAALKESHFLEVTGPEGEEKVNRKDAYNPLAPRSKAEARSVYVKGFGDEEPSSQFDIEAFFAPYGPTNAVRLRRTQEKLFKGSVFVEFVDEETAQEFLDLEPKPLWKGKHPLIIQSKKSYTDQKEQEIKDGKVEPAETWGRSRGKSWGRGRGGNRGDRGHYRNDREGRGRGDARGDRDPDDWKKRREEDRASGFKDNHRRNDRGRRDGGDRKGRGGRRDGDDRGPRSGDRNRDREEKDRYAKLLSTGHLYTKTRLVRSRTSQPRRLRMRRSDHVRRTKSETRSQPRRLTASPTRLQQSRPRNLQHRTRRSVLARMMEQMRPQRRRSIPSPRLLSKHHDTPRFAISFWFVHALSGVVSMAFIWDGGPFRRMFFLFIFMMAICSWLMQNRHAQLALSVPLLRLFACVNMHAHHRTIDFSLHIKLQSDMFVVECCGWKTLDLFPCKGLCLT